VKSSRSSSSARSLPCASIACARGVRGGLSRHPVARTHTMSAMDAPESTAATTNGRSSSADSAEGPAAAQGPLSSKQSQSTATVSVSAQETTSSSGGGGAAAVDSLAQTSTTSADGPTSNEDGSDQPLAMNKLLQNLPELSESERRNVLSTIERAKAYPGDLPLMHSWSASTFLILFAISLGFELVPILTFLHVRPAMLFSDTSAAQASHRRTSSQSQASAYSSNIQPLFTSTTVPELCRGLKALRYDGRAQVLGKLRQGQNYHFFRSEVAPIWEDPWNTKASTAPKSRSSSLFLYVVSQTDACCDLPCFLRTGRTLHAYSASTFIRLSISLARTSACGLSRRTRRFSRRLQARGDDCRRCRESAPTGRPDRGLAGRAAKDDGTRTRVDRQGQGKSDQRARVCRRRSVQEALWG
jgi:hypothetical protein